MPEFWKNSSQKWWQCFFKNFGKIHKISSLQSWSLTSSLGVFDKVSVSSRTFQPGLGLEGCGLAYITANNKNNHMFYQILTNFLGYSKRWVLHHFLHLLETFSLLQRSRVTLSYERHTKPIREYTRDQRISFFTIRSYPVFEKWYPYPIRILFWLKSCYPYPRTNRKCIVIHNIHSCALSILPHEAK